MARRGERTDVYVRLPALSCAERWLVEDVARLLIEAALHPEICDVKQWRRRHLVLDDQLDVEWIAKRLGMTRSELLNEILHNLIGTICSLLYGENRRTVVRKAFRARVGLEHRIKTYPSGAELWNALIDGRPARVVLTENVARIVGRLRIRDFDADVVRGEKYFMVVYVHVPEARRLEAQLALIDDEVEEDEFRPGIDVVEEEEEEDEDEL